MGLPLSPVNQQIPGLDWCSELYDLLSEAPQWWTRKVREQLMQIVTWPPACRSSRGASLAMPTWRSSIWRCRRWPCSRFCALSSPLPQPAGVHVLLPGIHLSGEALPPLLFLIGTVSSVLLSVLVVSSHFLFLFFLQVFKAALYALAMYHQHAKEVL